MGRSGGAAGHRDVAFFASGRVAGGGFQRTRLVHAAGEDAPSLDHGRSRHGNGQASARLAGVPEARCELHSGTRRWDVSRGVLSVLRDQLNGDGDFVADRPPNSGPSCRFELFGSGRSWLGPSGRSRPSPAPPRRRSPDRGSRFPARRSRNGPTASATQNSPRRSFCWAAGAWRSYPRSSRLGPRSRRNCGCACLARRRSRPEPLESCRGFRLKGPTGRESAQVLPIGLPCLPYETDRGAFLAARRRPAARPGDRGAADAGCRFWCPGTRRGSGGDRPGECLTVSERGKAVRPRSGLRRESELGPARDVRDLSQPGRSGLPRVSGLPHPRAVLDRPLHARRQRDADRQDRLIMDFAFRDTVLQESLTRPIRAFAPWASSRDRRERPRDVHQAHGDGEVPRMLMGRPHAKRSRVLAGSVAPARAEW